MKAEPDDSRTGLAIFTGGFRVPVRGRRKIQKLFRRIQKCEKTKMKVNLIFVGDGPMKELNRYFRRKNETTDVLSFPLEQNGRKIEGEIYISRPRAKKQAPAFGNDLEGEILRLAAHGLLHLLGYNHHSPDEKRKMFAREEKYLKGLGAADSQGAAC